MRRTDSWLDGNVTLLRAVWFVGNGRSQFAGCNQWVQKRIKKMRTMAQVQMLNYFINREIWHSWVRDYFLSGAVPVSMTILFLPSFFARYIA